MLRSFDESEKKSWDIGEIEVALNRGRSWARMPGLWFGYRSKID